MHGIEFIRLFIINFFKCIFCLLFRDERREYIQAKYVKKQFTNAPATTDEQLVELLRDAVDRKDLYAVLSVYFQVSFLS